MGRNTSKLFAYQEIRGTLPFPLGGHMMCHLTFHKRSPFSAPFPAVNSIHDSRLKPRNCCQMNGDLSFRKHLLFHHQVAVFYQ